MSLKIVSWNVNSLKVRQAQVLDYLQQEQADIIGLQELKQNDEAVAREDFERLGWHIITHGQKTYNGVALISKTAPEQILRGIPNYADEQARAIAATYGDLRIINLYVPNGKAVGDEKYLYKLQWLEALHGYISEALKQFPKLVVIGDFNIAPADIDVHDPQAWQDKILCSRPERQALEKLLALGLVDAFRSINPDRVQFSWWDYRMGGLRRNIGLRIDLNLVSSALSIEAADIDMQPRKLERPSDHAPAWVKIAD